MTTLRTRSRHSRTPRGSNDIQYQMAQFPCGTHVPGERERVSRETHPDDIDFEDPMIAQAERVIPENWKSPHQRTLSSRQYNPIRECLYTKEECIGPRQSAASTDLTAAQMFIQGNRLPRTPPRTESPRNPTTSRFYHSIEDPSSQSIVQDFRDVRTIIHDWSPRKVWLLHNSLNLYQSRQYCLMPCHQCVHDQNGITYHCQPCVRPRIPEQREGCLRLHHECLCHQHFYLRSPWRPHESWTPPRSWRQPSEKTLCIWICITESGLGLSQEPLD